MKISAQDANICPPLLISVVTAEQIPATWYTWLLKWLTFDWDTGITGAHRSAQICVCAFGEEQFKSTPDYLILKVAGGGVGGSWWWWWMKTGRIKCVNWIKGDWEIKKKGNKRGDLLNAPLLPAFKGGWSCMSTFSFHLISLVYLLTRLCYQQYQSKTFVTLH